MDVLGAVTGRTKKDPKEAAKARALKKRLMRRFPHLTSANIDVTEVNFDLDEPAAIAELSRAWGIPESKVDLDKPYGDGETRRRNDRILKRKGVKQRKRGQKAYNRQEREGVRRSEIARAMALHQNDDTPMGDNIQAAIRGFEAAEAAQDARDIRRNARRAQHAANREVNIAKAEARRAAV
jgi:hypothetical protein